MSDKHNKGPSTGRVSPLNTQPKSPMFLGWEPGSENEPKKSAPRLHHKKSRMGCQQCRARRVKGRPGTPSHSDSSRAKAYEMRPKTGPGIASGSQDNLDLPESSDRRLLELRLLHQFTADTVLTINVKTDPNIQVWATAVPRLAFKHDALLYGMYTLAALHIANLEPKNMENIATYQRYLALTLREHRDDVINLGPANADAAALTCSLLRIIIFTLLQELSQNPYTPPMEWLRISNTTGKGLNVAAWKYLHNDENSISRAFIRRTPGVNPNPSGSLCGENVLFQEANRHDLLHLLRRTPDDIATEPWDADIVKAYETAISYIGAIQLAIQTQEPTDLLSRRIILFPTMVNTGFLTLVEQQRPRALVVLAHYFAYLTDFRGFWWVGDTGPREVRGIESVLPVEWLDLMNWPLQAIENLYVVN